MSDSQVQPECLCAQAPVQPVEGGLRVWAPAKLNLNLLVGPRRADGFHPLDSLVAKVTFYDCIDLLRREDGQINFTCQGADCGSDERNLAYRAARLLVEQAGALGEIGGADIRLVKHIPPGKGLGGGSSDAAAVLAGLSALWHLRMDREELAELAAKLGSDVPLFLGPPSSRMTGRGENIEPWDIHDFAAVLILPDEHCGTADVYRTFDVLYEAGHAGRAVGRLADRHYRAQIDADVVEEDPPSAWRPLLWNDLWPAAATVCPRLTDLWETAKEAAGAEVCLTGSGSAMFIICDDPAGAVRTLAKLPPDIAGQSVIVRKNPW